MPPKKQELKAKQKVAEDKTFGLKNKNKSSKVQKYVQQVQQAAVQQQKKPLAVETKKEREQKRKEELAELFKPVQIQQKIPFGVDPKTVMCQFFKAGTCTKGKSCKFSHDSAIERKSTKIDIYTDARATTDGSGAGNGQDGGDNSAVDTMENWDQAQLEDVVNRKHGKQTTTDIVCKYFLQAVEERKYGWFWQCPNGGDVCKYKHALPPGFVLKEKGKKKAEDEVVQSLEEWIEEQRTHLPQKVTPVTLETFNEWKKKRQMDKEKQESEQNRQREAAIKAGKSIGASGRELFTYNPDMYNAGEDDDEAMDIDYTQREESDHEQDGDHVGVKRPHVSETEIDVAAFEGVSLEDLEEDE